MIKEIYHSSNYKEGVRVLMLINRGVQSSNKGSKRWVNKIISTNYTEYLGAFSKLVAQMEFLDNPDIRLYSCINARKLDKAINLFQHKQLDLPDDQKNTFYRRINENFVSCLMKPECRATSFFHLDVDCGCPDEAVDFCNDHKIIWHDLYSTPNGFHLITEPFNPELAKDCQTFEVKKDSLMLLAYME